MNLLCISHVRVASDDNFLPDVFAKRLGLAVSVWWGHDWRTRGTMVRSEEMWEMFFFPES